MPAQPTDPLVGSFLRRKRTWSDAYAANAVSTLNRWCAWLEGRGVDLCDASGDDCSDFLAERARQVTGATVHKDWQMLVWLYTWLVREGELPPVRRRGQLVEQSGRGPMNDIDAPAISDPHPERTRHVTAADYRRLMGSFDRRQVIDCRNAAICSLMYWSGVRCSEVARADLDRYDPGEGCLEILGKNANLVIRRVVPGVSGARYSSRASRMGRPGRAVRPSVTARNVSGSTWISRARSVTVRPWASIARSRAAERGVARFGTSPDGNPAKNLRVMSTGTTRHLWELWGTVHHLVGLVHRNLGRKTCCGPQESSGTKGPCWGVTGIRDLTSPPPVASHTGRWCRVPVQLYSITETAELLGLHPKTVERMIRRKEISATRIGERKAIRVRADDLQAFIDARTDHVDGL